MMPEYKKKQMYSYLIVLSICSTAGLQCWATLFDNFSVNIVGLEGHHIGALQSVREIPGFLALLVTYVILIIKEHKLSALSIIILGAGLFVKPFFCGITWPNEQDLSADTIAYELKQLKSHTTSVNRPEKAPFHSAFSGRLLRR